MRRTLAQTRLALALTRRQAAATQQRFDSLFAQNPDAVFTLDLEGHMISANEACERISGYPVGELLAMPSIALVFPDEVANAREHLLRALGGESHEFEVTIRHKSGRRITLLVTNIPIVSDGGVVGIYGVARDISLRRRLLDLTRPISATSSVEGQVNLILSSLVEVLPYDSGGLYWVDHPARVLRPEALVAANWVSSELDTFEVPLDGSVMGAVAQSNVGVLLNHAERDPRSIYPPGATVACEHLVAVPVAVDGRTVGVFYVARRNDPPFLPSDFEVVQLFIGHAAAAIEKMHLFEQTRASEARFQHQALHDPLTDLPNRVLLHDRLAQAIASARREPHPRPVALLVLDLDRFKEVNDTLGHHAGDRLLQEVGLRLRGALRESDTVASWAATSLPRSCRAPTTESAGLAAAKLQAALDIPLVLEGRELSLAASIGIAAFPTHGADADTLLRRADIAMYTAKRAQSGVATYAPEHDSHSAERLTVVAALRRAITLDELSLHYQPQIDFASGRLAGIEALVRWWHPERGMILPDQFLPLAEQSGLIRQLTRWVLTAALSQTAGWRRFSTGPGVSVNLSHFDLVDERLPEFVAAQLERWQFPAERLTLEITERAVLTDLDRALGVLGRLRKLGVRIALDDFGTGLSSLAHLKVWPLDEVKIDVSLVRGIVAAPADRAIVRATIELAHAFGLDVVAEGVENEGTRRLLEQMGVDRAQGYCIARPMPPSQLVWWCQTRSTSRRRNFPALAGSHENALPSEARMALAQFAREYQTVRRRGLGQPGRSVLPSPAVQRPHRSFSHHLANSGPLVRDVRRAGARADGEPGSPIAQDPGHRRRERLARVPAGAARAPRHRHRPAGRSAGRPGREKTLRSRFRGRAGRVRSPAAGPAHQIDLVIFNASLHYSTDYAATLRETLRVLRQQGYPGHPGFADVHRSDQRRAWSRSGGSASWRRTALPRTRCPASTSSP